MKKIKLAQMYDFRLKTSPWLIRYGDEPFDEIWRVKEASREGLELTSIRTGFFIPLHRDAIYDYRYAIVTPNFNKERQGIIKLLGFIWTRGDKEIDFEPLSLPRAERLFLSQVRLISK